MSIAVNEVGRLPARQGQMWLGHDCASAAAWFELIAERLVQSGGLRAGDAVLDVATSGGKAAIAAARCGCVVTGLDDVEALLDRGRERAAAEGLSASVQRRRRRAAALPGCLIRRVPVLPRRDVQTQASAGAGGLVRGCRLARTIALANWSPAGLLGRMFQTVAAHVPPPPLIWPPGFWGSEEHLLGGAVDDLTLTGEFVFRFRSPAEFVDAFRDSGGVGNVRRARRDRSRAAYEDLAALAARHDRDPGSPSQCQRSTSKRSRSCASGYGTESGFDRRGVHDCHQ
jgi:hypothetical protein